MLAIVHVPSPHLNRGLRTFAQEQAIDLDLARAQHAAYCRLLSDLGANLRVLDANCGLPDAVFIEDTAVVLDEVAILASMGAAARQPEPAAVEQVLREYRRVERIELPARLEGGDVLRIGRTLMVGGSCRTSDQGIAALANVIREYGYEVVPVTVRSCLHLKTACTALPDGRLLVNPAWIDVAALGGLTWVAVPADEPWAANVLPIDGCVCLPAAHVRTTELVASLGFEARTLDLSEFAKAEGGITCLSLLFQE